MVPWQKSLWKLPVLSGILLAMSYFSFSLPFSNFIAFLPILYWLDENRDAPCGDRLRAGLFFGLTANLLALHWVYAMLSISWLAVPLYLFLAAVLGIGIGIAIALAGWIRRATGWSFAWILPACWLPPEWARTWGDTKLTADHMGHTLAGSPFLVQFADLVGPYGVGAFMLVSNALLYESIRGWKEGKGRRAALSLAILFAAVIGYDAWRWTHPPEKTGTLRVAYVQPNIPLDVKSDFGSEDEQLSILAEMTLQAAKEGAELIVWPETARPAPLYHWLEYPETYVIPDVQILSMETGVPILTGVEYARVRSRDDFDVYNAALVARPDGRLEPRWTAKVYLVPFTELIPFEPILGRFLEDRKGELRWMAGGFTAGPRATTLPAAGHEVGLLVCYEELYSDLARTLRNAGAELQVVITNDAWFGRTLFQEYMANAVRLRAIETRSSFVRAANTGISGFLDPMGRYHRRTGLFVPGMELFDVPLAGARSLYTRTGDVVAWLAIASLVVLTVAAWSSSKSRRVREGEPHELVSDRSDLGGLPGAGPESDGPGDRPGRDGGGSRGDPAGNGHDHPGRSGPGPGPAS
jgi:apolipoprotein N-acyltransferase